VRRAFGGLFEDEQSDRGRVVLAGDRVGDLLAGGSYRGPCEPTPGRPRPDPMIFLGLLIWLVAELYAFVAVARAIGVLLAFVLLIGTSFVGSALLRREGARACSRIRGTISNGRS